MDVHRRTSLSSDDLASLSHRLVRQIAGYGIYVLDTDRTILSWGRGAQELFGYRSDEIVGSPVSRLYAPDHDRLEPPEEFREASEKGQAPFSCWMMRQDGSRF